ncbi:NUDIX domain-containing protein [Candidatus Pacearchaeota archaeon]|nr:NUDIX domain-containing protein [Candidatus Pacearchaeota archaeon]
MKLSDEDFLKVVKLTPLISIDLIVRDPNGKILMGKRKNQPARESWFVPGGRIRKDECFDKALTRIGREELDAEVTRSDVCFMGIFDHPYTENFANIDGISTQYIVLAHECYIDDLDFDNLPKKQHSDWKWFCKSQSGDVHGNSAAYFEINIDDAGYSALNARRISYDNMLWQTPVMSLIAQAFLFSIILSGNTEPVSQIIAAILAIFTSIASLQLLAKHRHGEETCAKELVKIESLTNRYPTNQYHKSERRFVKYSSYEVWFFVLLLFGIAALCTIFRPLLIILGVF